MEVGLFTQTIRRRPSRVRVLVHTFLLCLSHVHPLCLPLSLAVLPTEVVYDLADGWWLCDSISKRRSGRSSGGRLEMYVAERSGLRAFNT